jgi:uncharacterized repeat protein (TIGR02543 family)
MNLKQKLAAICLTFCAATAAIPSTSNAGTYATGDLVLYFFQEAGTQTIYANLGPAYTYRGGAAGSQDAVKTLNILNLKSALEEAYGTNWAQLDNLYAGLAAVRSSSTFTTAAAVNGDPGRTVYTSVANNLVDEPGGRIVPTNTGMTTISNGMISMNTRFPADVDFAVVPSADSFIERQNPFFAPGILGTAFGGFAGGVAQKGENSPLGTFGDISNVEFALNLHRILATEGGAGTIIGGLDADGNPVPIRTSTYEGTITINSNGIVGFSVAASAPPPAITVYGSLTGLDTTIGSPSATTSFIVSGANMKEGITITAPDGFEVSSSNNTGFASSITIGAAGTIESTTIYVRLSASASAGNYSGDITLTSGSTAQTIATAASTVSTGPDYDSDGDGLVDSVETNTGVFISSADVGTNPNNADTDADGVPDGLEVKEKTSPVDATNFNSFSKGIVAYYPFDGSANDMSGYANHGVVNGAVLSNDRLGRANAAYYFDGSNFITGGNVIPNYKDGATLSCWVKSTHIGLQQGAVGKPRPYGDYCGFAIGIEEVSGTARAGLNTGTGPGASGVVANEVVNSQASIADDRWRHLLATTDGNKLVFYMDGEFIGEEQIVSDPISSDRLLQIGREGEGGPQYGPKWFVGSVDDIRAYNRALSAEEVASLYAAESPPRYQIIEGSYTWHEAKADAEARGGRLAVLDTQEKIDAVRDFFQTTGQGGHLHLGMTDEQQEGEWKWIDGSPVVLTNWEVGEPNNLGDEDYGMIYFPSAKWNNGHVSSYLGYLFETGYPAGPANGDADGDGLIDAVETNTGVFVSASDTGTNPNNADTDGDGLNDGAEVQQGTDPTKIDQPGWKRVATEVHRADLLRTTEGVFHTNNCYSTNGVNWKTTTYPPHSYWINNSGYGSGTFVLTGAVGQIWTSNNFEDWSERSPGGEDITDVVYGNGIFIARKFWNTAGLWVSTNQGQTWTSADTGPVPDRGRYNKIAFGNNTFVRPAETDVKISTDGFNWTTITPPNRPSQFSFREGICYVPSAGFVLAQKVAESNGEVTIMTASSAQGEVWNFTEARVSTNNTGDINISGFAGDLLFACAYDGSKDLTEVWCSADQGQSWQLVESGPWNSPDNDYAQFGSNGTILAVGTGSEIHTIDLDEFKNRLNDSRPRFQIVEGTYTWHEAKADAEARGGRLAVLDTQEKTNQANAFLQSQGSWSFMWIGLSDDQNEGQWKWINGQDLAFSNWQPYQPSGLGPLGSDEDYAHILPHPGENSGMWNDLPNEGGYNSPIGYLLELPEVSLDFVGSSNGLIAGAGNYELGATAILTATPNPGYTFAGWTGDASGTTNPLSITMDADKTVGATFEPDYADNDGDGLTNYEEVAVYYTNLNASDTDADGYSDGEEVEWGSDPTDSMNYPSYPNALGYALDSTEYLWMTGGDSMWFAQSEVSYDGEASVQSGLIDHNGQNWIETTITGPCSLSFWWKVSSEANYDFLDFSINGEVQERISGEVEWAPKNYFLSWGEHTIRWRYSKDLSVARGADAGWVDRVAIDSYPVELDLDGDGYSNGEELQWGTDPNDYWSKPQVYLIFSSNGRGQINPTGIDDYYYWYYGSYSGNVPLRSSVNLTAIPDAGYLFAGWTGDSAGEVNPLDLQMDANKSFQANFAPDYSDTDGDGLSNYEEATVYYTDLNSSDSDGDGLQDGYELGLERFTIVMGSRTWAQAKAHAESQGGMLATFASQEEWDIAMRSIGEDALLDLGGLWIGATDEATEGTWKWITGESLTFDLWETGQPDNFNNSDHAAVAGDMGGNMGRWYDFRSTSTRDGYLMESGYATSPTRYDSDGDNLSDGEEQIAGTNALVADSDGDGLNDWVEVELADTDPLRTDTDGNGTSDADDDKDGDGLSNYDEVTVYNTDLRSPDSDGDGFSDGEEVERGSGPNDGFSKPQVYLSFSSSEGGHIDASGIDYYYYWYYGSYSGNVQLRSSITLTAVPYPGYVFSGWIGDASGLANPLDLQMDDSKSIQANFGPDLADSDGDGLSNHAEIITYGSDPNLVDSNGDGLRDGLVVTLGKNPMEDVSSFMNAIMANRTELGLHTTEDITDMRPGTMMIERAAGTNKMQFRMKFQKSNDLHNWQDDGEAVFEAPYEVLPTKRFYRFGVK